ncbi:SGNH/GDSL hydrolase family protein [Kitasatospora viridis]|uniref:Lysophospholipase L1-like esterase n=1 Tax=Kitasatospora viridis TaxID=281105 RepID=A0A561UJJ5_9ACTN|nr:SGNH/GDSL hydrolase family protein [Kitasatospora viridis]TWF99542.1 lysophospholipase L1-like esterase [Kitasatospora viridis]
MPRLLHRSLAAVLGALCGPLLLTAAPAAARTGPPVVRVMPLGDSITAGVGSHDGAGYRLPLRQDCAEQSRFTLRLVGSQHDTLFPGDRHEGHSGWMVADLTARIDGWLAAARPDVVLLHIGINDLDRGPDKPHAADRLAALLDRIYTDRPGVSVLLLGLLPTTEGLEQPVRTFNRRVEDLSATEWRLGRDFDYLRPPELTPAEFADRLHPDDLGYQRIADRFYHALTDAVARRAARP